MAIIQQSQNEKMLGALLGTFTPRKSFPSRRFSRRDPSKVVTDTIMVHLNRGTFLYSAPPHYVSAKRAVRGVDRRPFRARRRDV